MESRITIDPTICNGKPTIKGTRITVQSILEYMAAGDAESDILEMFPKLSKADLQACLAFASKLSGHSYEVKTVA